MLRSSAFCRLLNTAAAAIMVGVSARFVVSDLRPLRLDGFAPAGRP